MDTNQLLTREQATALIKDVAKTMTPAEPKPLALAKRLEPFKSALLEQRTMGFTNKELVTMLASPKIGLEVSESMLRKFLNGTLTPKKRKKKQPPLNLDGTAVPPKASTPKAAG